jgi:hypothetical protein
VSQGGVEPIDRIARVLYDIFAEMSQQFERNALNVEIMQLGLFAGDGSYVSESADLSQES